MDAAATERGGGGLRSGAGAADAVMIRPPDQSPQNSLADDSRTALSHTKPVHDESTHHEMQDETIPISPENSPLPSQSSLRITTESSTPKRNALLPSLHPSSPRPGSWMQTKSPTSGSNPFYTSQPSYRSSTPPIPSSAEQSPLISPAKRFSTGEVKPLYAPNSPRQPLNQEDRAKFSQVRIPQRPWPENK